MAMQELRELFLALQNNVLFLGLILRLELRVLLPSMPAYEEISAYYFHFFGELEFFPAD